MQCSERSNSDGEDLPHSGLPGLGQDQVTDDAQKVTDTTGNSAEQEVAQTQEIQPEALTNDDLLLPLQEADGNHDDTANCGTSISKEQDIHNSLWQKSPSLATGGFHLL